MVLWYSSVYIYAILYYTILENNNNIYNSSLYRFNFIYLQKNNYGK